MRLCVVSSQAGRSPAPPTKGAASNLAEATGARPQTSIAEESSGRRRESARNAAQRTSLAFRALPGVHLGFVAGRRREQYSSARQEGGLAHHGCLPFGFGVQGQLDENLRSEFWAYRPPYARETCLWIHGSNETELGAPLVFVVEMPTEIVERSRARIRLADRSHLLAHARTATVQRLTLQTSAPVRSMVESVAPRDVWHLGKPPIPTDRLRKQAAGKNSVRAVDARLLSTRLASRMLALGSMAPDKVLGVDFGRSAGDYTKHRPAFPADFFQHVGGLGIGVAGSGCSTSGQGRARSRAASRRAVARSWGSTQPRRARASARSVSKIVSKNWVDSGGLEGTREDKQAARKTRNPRTLATKGERHRQFAKCHSLGFDSRRLHQNPRRKWGVVKISVKICLRDEAEDGLAKGCPIPVCVLVHDRPGGVVRDAFDDL